MPISNVVNLLYFNFSQNTYLNLNMALLPSFSTSVLAYRYIYIYGTFELKNTEK